MPTGSLYIASIVTLLVFYAGAAIAGPESISECDGDGKVPYRAIVNEDNTVQISCRYVDCVNVSKETPVCQTEYHQGGCEEFPQWLHGVRQPKGGNRKPFQTKCCSYQRLLYGQYLGTTVLRRNQGFLGGFAYIKGRENTNKRDGFDVITNMTKEGNAYRIWVYRLRCIPPPPKEQKPSNPNQYYDTRLTAGDPGIEYQNLQLRGQNGNPALSVPLVYSSGCFSSDTTVYSKQRGPISIDQLKVGEDVLTVHGRTASYRPVSFFLHRDSSFAARYLTLRTDRSGVNVTLTPYHIIFSDQCTVHPEQHYYPQKFAKEVEIGQCLMWLDRETGRMESVRVTNITESWRKGIYSPITSNGVIVTNDLISSCYSFVKNQDLQASIFYYMMHLETFLEEYFSMPTGWLLGGRRTKVDVPLGLNLILNALDYVLPVSKLM